MGRTQNCLLCYSECITGKWPTKKEFFGASGQLANQIVVIFVVRKILNISKSTCEKLLEDLGNPSSWNVGYCAKCTNVVQEAQFLSEQLEDLQQKLSNISLKIKTHLFQSYKKKEKSRAGLPNASWGAIDEIRFQFSKEFSKSSKKTPETRLRDAANGSTSNGRVSGSNRQLSSYNKLESLNLKTDSVGDQEGQSFSDNSIEEVWEQSSSQVPDEQEEAPEVYDHNPISPDWQPSEDDCSSDPEYKPASRCRTKNKRNPSTNKSDEIKKIRTDAVVKIELPEPGGGDADDISLIIENVNEFDANCEKRKQDLLFGENSLENSSERNFPCPICGYKLRSALARDAHEKRVHLGIRNPFTCEVCSKTYPKKCELETHMQLHLPGSNVFLCPKCHRKFPNKITRNAHIQSFHYGVKCPYKCTKCGKKFQRPSSLEVHLISKHKIVLANPIADPKRKELYRQKIESGWKKVVKVPEESDIKVKCTEENCSRLFQCEMSRDAHVKRVHQGIKCPYDCPSCPKKFKSMNELDTHKCKTKEDEPPAPKQTFSCEECGKTFKNKTCLASHFKTTIHLTGPKPFMCELCSQTFQCQKYLEDHQKLRHFEELNLVPNKCPECGKILGSEKSLKLHIKYIHKKEYNFTCEVCSMGFEYENTKMTHMRVHTGERPYKCNFCNKSFAQTFHLKSHMRVHTGEKPYKCLTCSKCFSDKPTFNRHVEMHKGILHECSVCFKKYPTRHAFRVHMKSHEGGRPRTNSKVKRRRKTRSGRSKKTISDEDIDAVESASNSADVPPPPEIFHPVPESLPTVEIEPLHTSTSTTDEFRDMPRLFAASMLTDCNY